VHAGQHASHWVVQHDRHAIRGQDGQHRIGIGGDQRVGVGDRVLRGTRAAAPVRLADDPHPGPVDLAGEDEVAGADAEG
jgi:hypothetical protein